MYASFVAHSRATVVSAVLLGCSSLILSQESVAQEREAREGFELEEITVTARRREETLQNTPIAVTAVSGTLLEEIGVEDLTGIANIAPNVSFSTTGTVSGSTSSAVVYIRGIGQNDYVPVVDPGVGIYVDDVYLGRTVGSVLDLLDIQSVEVIRGPQGTLFGRNTIGGAISITTNSPTGETGGRFRTVIGDNNRREFFGSFDLPLSDSVNALVSVISRDRDGYVTRVNTAESDDLGDENSKGARLKLDFDVTDKLSLRFTADYVREREQSAPEVIVFFNDSATLPAAWNGYGAFAPFAPGSTASGCVQGDPTVGIDCYNPSQQRGPFETGETSESRNDIDTWGLSAAATLQLSDAVSLKAIIAHRDLEAFFARQVDGTEFNVFENRDMYFQNQTSLDIRLNGAGERVNWVAGAFYYEEEADNQLDFTGVLEGTLYPIHFGGIVDNNNYAAYGEATIKLTDRLQFTGGVRYTEEEKNATPNAFAYPGCSIDLLPTDPLADCDSTLSPVDIPRRTIGTTGYLIDPVLNSNSFDQVTWRANLAFAFTDTASAYFSASTGFKSGGFEWRVTNTTFASDPSLALPDGSEGLPQFRPEEITTYEIGLKADLSDTLRLNVAAFSSDYEDLIVAANVGGIATFQTNAGTATIDGFEIEATWVPTESLFVNFAAGFLDAQYDELIVGSTITREDDFVFTPDTTVSIGASYLIDLDSGASITTRIDGVYKSDIEFEAANTAFTRDDGYNAWDVSIRYSDASDVWDLTLGVDNATDELYAVGGDANSAIGYENVIFARPRNYYLSFGYRF